MPRHEYVLALANRPPGPQPESALGSRHPNPGDHEALAILMLDAYTDTIDYDGEGIGEARDEVAGYLGGNPLLEHSFVAAEDDRLVSACLISLFEGEPLVGYAMTAADHKSQGLASVLLEQSLGSLERAGHGDVTAWITEGNRPSERIFRRAGFRRRRD